MRRFLGRVLSSKDFLKTLINALKLQVNQQKDGDSPIQNIIMGLKEKCRELIANGLRSFIELDKHSALEVGHWRRGQRPFVVVRPKMSSEVLRDGADDFDAKSGII